MPACSLVLRQANLVSVNYFSLHLASKDADTRKIQKQEQLRRQHQKPLKTTRRCRLLLRSARLVQFLASSPMASTFVQTSQHERAKSVPLDDPKAGPTLPPPSHEASAILRYTLDHLEPQEGILPTRMDTLPCPRRVHPTLHFAP